MTDAFEGFDFKEVRELGVTGRPFDDTDRYFSRLPERARMRVNANVWRMAQYAAGMTVEFVTDSTVIAAELCLEDDPERVQPGLDCMVDLYAWDGERWGWAGILRERTRPVSRGLLLDHGVGEPRRYRLYLPHAGLLRYVKLGFEPGSSVEPVEESALKPICCYGTSIVHGFTASRTGMTLPAQLGRRLRRPVWNLGLAGNAKMDPELVEFLAELDPAVYIVDCLPNMTPDLVAERTGPFVRGLRTARPDTPILLVENIVYQATYMLAESRLGWGDKNDALRDEFIALRDEGIPHLHYLKGDYLLGRDGEATVDGTHPNDLGFVRLTDAYESAVIPLLGSH